MNDMHEEAQTQKVQHTVVQKYEDEMPDREIRGQMMTTASELKIYSKQNNSQSEQRQDKQAQDKTGCMEANAMEKIKENCEINTSANYSDKFSMEKLIVWQHLKTFFYLQ